MRGRALAVGLVLLVGVSAAQAAVKPKPARTWVTDGTVYAIADAGDTIYIGGHFTQVGPRTGPGVGIDASTGKSIGLPEVSGGKAEGAAVADDGAGGWYIGGDFTWVGGLERHNVAHIRGDGRVDPGWNPD